MLLPHHLNNIETKLLAYFDQTGLFAASANLGLVREAFVRSFLKRHLGNKASIGSGEIIDCNSTNEYQSRNQHDVIIHDPSYPKLDFEVLEIQLYLVESVFATIEIKSTLKKSDLDNTLKAAAHAKSLRRNLQHNSSRATFVSASVDDWWPQGITNFLVAYNGPSIPTVHGWLQEVHTENKLSYPLLPKNERNRTQAPSIDGIFVLGKGFLLFNNNRFISSSAPIELQDQNRWLACEQSNGNLQVLFYLLCHSIDGLNLEPYLQIRLPMSPLP